MIYLVKDAHSVKQLDRAGLSSLLEDNRVRGIPGDVKTRLSALLAKTSGNAIIFETESYSVKIRNSDVLAALETARKDGFESDK